jgi:hypothetical protein
MNNDSFAVVRFREEVAEAAELLEYAVESGSTIADTIVDRIAKAESLAAATDAERADFNKAYRDLVKAMSPVTIWTLRATEDGKPGPTRRWISKFLFPNSSDAKVFSKQLWVWVILAASFIVFSQLLPQFYVPDEESATTGSSELITLTRSVLPFFYGLLGALTYLLRSAHSYIADRTFDLKRTPEYYNRMLLGFVGGGVVLLFVDPKTFNVTEGALAFIVGYNTDYLFALLERLAGAIFPRTSGAPAQDKSRAAAKATVASLKVSPAQLAPGGSGKGMITLISPAPSTGVAVALSSDHPLTMPKVATVAGGTSSVDFDFTAPGDAPSSPITITATANDSTANASVRMLVPLALKSVSAQKGADGSITGWVELTGAPSADGTSVAIDCDEMWCHLAAKSLSVPSGAKQAAFTATADEGSTGTITFTATLNGTQAKGTVKI